MKKLFTLLFVLCSLTLSAQVKKKPAVKQPVKNQYYVVKEQIAKLNTKLELVEFELKQLDYLYNDKKFIDGNMLKIGQQSTTYQYKDSSDVVKQNLIKYYEEQFVKIDETQTRKNELVNKISQLEYKLATLPNPEGHWKTYYKGSRKLTVWVENGIEYQYPPKK